MRRRLEDFWDICRFFGIRLLFGAVGGTVVAYLWIWLTDFISDLDSWFYLLIPVAIAALFYRVIYVCVYRRTYSL
jgi:NhaP-type Na+/H+ or K+/H+ antiporter